VSETAVRTTSTAVKHHIRRLNVEIERLGCVLRKPRVQSSVFNRSIAMSSITASAAGTPPADQAFKSVRVAA
jgi:hypothetical protein